MLKNKRISSCLAATVVLLGSAGAAGLQAQSTCTSSLFTISSSNGTNFPAAGGSYDYFLEQGFRRVELLPVLYHHHRIVADPAGQ